MASAKRAERVSAGAPDGAAFAGAERVVNSLVGLGLLGGLDRTSLQLSHGDGDVFGGHEGLSDRLFVPSTACIDDLEGLNVREGLAELCGGSGLNELHAC